MFIDELRREASERISHDKYLALVLDGWVAARTKQELTQLPESRVHGAETYREAVKMKLLARRLQKRVDNWGTGYYPVSPCHEVYAREIVQAQQIFRRAHELKLLARQQLDDL